MDYSNLTEEQIIDGVKNGSVELSNLSEEQRDNKKIVLLAVKKNGWAFLHASERLQNDKQLLEIVENRDVSSWPEDAQLWYQERMEFLANLREKELMENSINSNIKLSKKIKF